MSTKISGYDIRESLQGKDINSNIREKIGDYFNDSFSNMEVKNKLASELANKTELSRKRAYRKMGLNEIEREEIEGFFSDDDSSN